MDTEIRRHSVTANDVGDKSSSVVHWMLDYQPVARTGLPAYWSPSRDYYLRRLLYSDFHDFWSGAIGIAITKMASLDWELESSQPRIRNYFQQVLLTADDNQSWGRFMARHLQDFLCTDNGAFVEIVRASSAAGSRILGLMHLDSLRCTRTGDPAVPVLYRDTQGVTHEVQAHQVLLFADMPSSTETYHGVGLCAASRAWGGIKKLEAIERYIYEKISGDRALALDLLGGVLEKDIRTGVESAREQNEARGNTSYLGAVMIPVPSDVPLSHVRINFAELPDGFDYDKQVNNCILTYANAIGLDVQDLQPLTGRPLGTGAQSEILQDKSSGKGLAAWRQQFTHLLNQFVLPDAVTFAFAEKDLRDQQRQADINKTITDTVAEAVEKIGLSTAQGQQLLADSEVIPQEFVPQDTTPRETLSDSEKPEVEQAAQDVAQPAQAQQAMKEFNPRQPRDDNGKWTSGGGGGDFLGRLFASGSRKRASTARGGEIVYRGWNNKNRGNTGYLFVTPKRELARAFGQVTAYRVKKGGKIFPDAEIEGATGKLLSGIGSLKRGSAIIHSSDLTPIMHGLKELNLGDEAEPQTEQMPQEAPTDINAATKEGQGDEPVPFPDYLKDYRERFAALSQ